MSPRIFAPGVQPGWPRGRSVAKPCGHCCSDFRVATPCAQTQVGSSQAEALAHPPPPGGAVTGALSCGAQQRDPRHRDLGCPLRGVAQVLGEPPRQGALGPQTAHVGRRSHQPAPRGVICALCGPSQDAVRLAQVGWRGRAGGVLGPQHRTLPCGTRNGKQNSGQGVPGSLRASGLLPWGWCQLGVKVKSPVFSRVPREVWGVRGAGAVPRAPCWVARGQVVWPSVIEAVMGDAQAAAWTGSSTPARGNQRGLPRGGAGPAAGEAARRREEGIAGLPLGLVP